MVPTHRTVPLSYVSYRYPESLWILRRIYSPSPILLQDAGVPAPIIHSAHNDSGVGRVMGWVSPEKRRKPKETKNVNKRSTEKPVQEFEPFVCHFFFQKRQLHDTKNTSLSTRFIGTFLLTHSIIYFCVIIPVAIGIDGNSGF